MDLSRTLDVVIGLIFILGPLLFGESAVSLMGSNVGRGGQLSVGRNVADDERHCHWRALSSWMRSPLESLNRQTVRLAPSKTTAMDPRSVPVSSTSQV